MNYLTLSNIAWETTKAMNILGEFGYKCLYEMEDTYNLQGIAQEQFENVIKSLGDQDFEGLVKHTNLLVQFQKSLLENYRKVLVKLDECR